MGKKAISPAAAVVIIVVVLIIIIVAGFLYLRGRGGASGVPEEVKDQAALDDQETIDPVAEAARARPEEGRQPLNPDDADSL